MKQCSCYFIWDICKRKHFSPFDVTEQCVLFAVQLHRFLKIEWFRYTLQVACSLNHTLALSADGNTLWAFGEGEFGQLGIGRCSHKTSPTSVVQLSKKELKKVACGTQFSVALTKTGKVYIFGHCEY